MTAEPIGVILAGGAGRRLGGDKAGARLAGRPLIAHPVAAMRAAVTDVAIVTKAAVTLPACPELEGVAVWVEPSQPCHPLVGIVHALRVADGRAVLVCAADLPFVTAALLRALAIADAAGAPAVLATGPEDDLQPLLGRYEPSALGLLAGPAAQGTASVRATVAELCPRYVALDDPAALFNVNSAAELAEAEEMIAGGARPR